MSNKEMNEAVDFSNPEAIEAELAAVEAAAPVAGERKPAKPKVIKVSFTADKDYKAGDVIEFNYEVPKGTSTRGSVAGIPLTEMTVDQLKIEHRNANSVYYKSKKANKNADTIAKAEARLEAVKAEMEARGIQPNSRSNADLGADDIAKLIISGKVSVEDIQAILNASAAN